MPPVVSGNGFSLRLMATNWGFSGSFQQFCREAKNVGYNGVEVWWTDNPVSQREIFDSVEKEQLDIAFLCGGWQSD